MLRFLFVVLIFVLSPLLPVSAQLNSEPDRIETENGEIIIHPILHGTVVFEWNDINIYIDPYGGAERFRDLGNPDLIVITHAHGDHLNPETLAGLNTDKAAFIVPQSVADEMPDKYQDQLVILTNGESESFGDISVLAVPMYNLPEEDARHAKGWGNGYVLTVGGKNIYISGDTEDIPEMRNLTNIDVAFVCMNLPYTMDIKQAAGAVLDFEPEIVYPYHHRGQDIYEFNALVDAGRKNIEVRLKDWYSEQ